MKPLDVLLILVALLFFTGLIVDRRWRPQREEHRTLVRLQQEQLDVVVEKLREHHRQTGRYPSNAEGLDVVPGLRDALVSGALEPARRYLDRSEGVRTIYGIPYLYENRRQIRRQAFSASPVRDDNKARRRFSRAVDDQVFVSSLGLREDVQGFFGRAWLDALLLFVGGAIVVMGIAYVFARNRRSADRVRGINAMLLVGVAVVLGVIISVSGSPPLARGGQRLPDQLGAPRLALLEEYRAILEDFAERGAIAAADCRRILDELDAEFGIQRAAPEGGPPAGESPPPAEGEGRDG